MKYYSIKEAAEKMQISQRKLYDYVKQIEQRSPYQFGRMARGNYYMGHPRKEKVISERDIGLLEHFEYDISAQNLTVFQAIQAHFFPDE